MRTLRGLGLVSFLFFVIWSFVVPVFEGPDEFLHWQYARYLHDAWRLPVYGPHFEEANSPPLYYAAIAPIASRTPTPPRLIWADGRDQVEHPFGVRLHLTASDDFSHYWPLRIARLISALMALATVLLGGLAAKEVTGRDSTALLAAGFAAFLPQFTFRGMNVSNDVLVTAMSAWLLFLIARIVTRGFTWRIGALAAVALAGAFLSKISAICLAPALVLAIVSEPVPWRARVRHLAVVGGLTILIVLPWSLRNVMLYGDPFASAAMNHAVPGLIVERSMFDLAMHITLPRELFKSFVGAFGYAGVKLPKWLYAVYLACMAFAALGLMKGLARKDADTSAAYVRVLLILIAIVALNYLVVLRINVQFDQPQGRYMFPALPAIVVALALGLERWPLWKRRPAAASLFTIGACAAANVAILLLIVAPSYYPPLIDTISRVVTPVPVDQACGDVVGSAGQVRVPAPDARFVLFEVQGRSSQPEMSGTVILGLERENAAGAARDVTERRFPFRWLGDGRERTIYITSLREPDWQGDVVSVRVAPNDDERKRDGSPACVANLRLAGSIPTNDF